MAFWNRLNQCKLKLLLSLQSKGTRYGSLLVYSTRTSGSCLLENRILVFHEKPAALTNNFRYFGASVQAKQKVEDASRPILNDQIKSRYVRLVSDEGHSIITAHQALEQAKSVNLDLVVVQRNVDPPVCKIMDYNKEKYKRKEKEKQQSKSKLTLRKGDCKEVRFSGKTEQKDLKMKTDTIKRLMVDGYRVKCVALPSKKGKASPKMVSGDGVDEEGKELKSLFTSLINLIEDESIIELGPIVRNGQAHMIVRHVKFGPAKKGGAKKSKDAEKVPAADGTSSSEDDQPDGRLENGKTAWSDDDSAESFEEIFKISGEATAILDAAVSPTELKVPNLLNHSQVHELRRERFPPFQPEPSLITENRYRTEPRTQFSPTKFTDGRGTDTRDSSRLQPQFPSQRGQPQPERKQGIDSPAFRSFNGPSPSRTFKQEPPPPPTQASRTPASSYGIFSSQETSMPGRPGVATESNRYVSNAAGFGTKPNVPDGQTSGSDRGGPGPFGIFSRDGPSVNQNSMPKSG